MKIRSLAIALALSIAARLEAQAAAPAAPAPLDPAKLRVAASGRVKTEVTLAMPRTPDQPATTPVKISVDYGQPHARGREIVGGLVPFDSVWRTGANSSTTFTTDVDLTIGGTFVPKGSYSLYTLPTRAGWKLIVNRQTGQWGTTYDAARDLARIDLASRTLTEPRESFSITIVPAVDAPGATQPPAHGQLVLSWGTTELSTDWKVGR
ncbi:MAG TPA: DUF2911 domain-containing protein [Gemmatimonadaceae bacterium]|nr:DUF2911 domain-containing protein [Gemmatimonadaceae bacterium]